MPSRDRQSLEDMLGAARKIIEYAQVIQRDLPDLMPKIEAILNQLP